MAQRDRIHARPTEPGFTAWFWSAFPQRPEQLQLTWLNSPEPEATVPYPPPGSPTSDIPEARVTRTYYPPQGEDPVVVRPGIRWQKPEATITIAEVFFYSTGVYLPLTSQTVARMSRDWLLRMSRATVNGKPADRESGHGHDDGLTYTTWLWIEADGTRDPLRVQLNRPDFPGADATVSYPPPGSPATPSPDVPVAITDRGNNWSRNSVRLSSTRR